MSGKALIALLLISLPALAAAEGLLDRIKQGAATTYERGSELVKEGAAQGKELTEKGVQQGTELTGKGVAYGKQFADDTVEHFDRRGTPEEIRAGVDKMAIDTLDELFANDPEAHLLFDRSAGYAVFAVRQVTVGLAAGYGYGVAVGVNGDSTYMKMATGGVGVNYGVGGFASNLVVLFEDEEAYRRFVELGFSASAEASGTAGDDRTELATHFENGVAFYRVTKKGLNVAASLTGTRFWPDESLN